MAMSQGLQHCYGGLGRTYWEASHVPVNVHLWAHST